MGVYLRVDEPIPYLCFTANEANSTVQLRKTGNPTSVTLETSTDGATWTSYTIGDTITLTNMGDKIYWRNTSDVVTLFSTSASNCYRFVMTGSISGSGDCNYLLCKNSTITLPGVYCFYRLFYDCGSLTSAPKLPATTITGNCYDSMFNGCYLLTETPELPATTLDTSCYRYMFVNCSGLTKLPKLLAETLSNYCYYSMFSGCSNIKLSTTQEGEYQTEYRIPYTGTGTTATSALNSMFSSTGGTFAGTPSINTAYYTSNTVV